MNNTSSASAPTSNEIVGFRAYHHGVGSYLHFDSATNRNFLAELPPTPVSRADAHRRIAAFIEQTGEEGNDDFSIDPVYREYTPVERASAELGTLLTSLCNRHGLNLGRSQEEINAQIAKELEALKAGESPSVAFLAGGVPRSR